MSDIATRLRRERITDQLAALEAEYKAIAAARRTTLDPSSGVKMDQSLKDLENQIAALDAELKTLPGAPVQQPVGTPAPVPNRTALRKALIEQFSLQDMQILSDDLGVDFENLGGQGKNGKALELVLYFERRGQLAKLADKVREERPDSGV